MNNVNNDNNGKLKTSALKRLLGKPKPGDYEYDNEIDWEEYYEESENYELEHEYGGLR